MPLFLVIVLVRALVFIKSILKRMGLLLVFIPIIIYRFLKFYIFQFNKVNVNRYNQISKNHLRPSITFKSAKYLVIRIFGNEWTKILSAIALPS